MEIAHAWQCQRGCNVFETVGIPVRCPHCGIPEVYPQRESLRDFTTFDNENVPTRFSEDRNET